MEAEDSELVKPREGVRSEGAAQTEPMEDEANHTALRAFHSLPLAVVEAFVESVEEFVV